LSRDLAAKPLASSGSLQQDWYFRSIAPRHEPKTALSQALRDPSIVDRLYQGVLENPLVKLTNLKKWLAWIF
jgi:hypothetical protein